MKPKEFLFQEFSPATYDATAFGGNTSTNQDQTVDAIVDVMRMRVSGALTHRKIYAYLFGKIVNDNFATLECRITLLHEDGIMLRLPVVFAYKTTGLGNAYQINAFTWSLSTATVPLLLPDSISLKTKSIFTQPVNPPPDETSDLVYLHPRSLNFPISEIRVDIVRWTNINFGGSFPMRLVIATQAE